jgi:hypothetical protein
MDEKLIVNSRKCGDCNQMMELVIANDRSDDGNIRGIKMGSDTRLRYYLEKTACSENTA